MQDLEPAFIPSGPGRLCWNKCTVQRSAADADTGPRGGGNYPLFPDFRRLLEDRFAPVPFTVSELWRPPLAVKRVEQGLVPVAHIIQMSGGTSGTLDHSQIF